MRLPPIWQTVSAASRTSAPTSCFRSIPLFSIRRKSKTLWIQRRTVLRWTIRGLSGNSTTSGKETSRGNDRRRPARIVWSVTNQPKRTSANQVQRPYHNLSMRTGVTSLTLAAVQPQDDPYKPGQSAYVTHVIEKAVRENPFRPIQGNDQRAPS